MLNDSIVDGRALREVYLLAFEKAVREAEPWTVMGAYNKLNGIYCCEHPDLLTDIYGGSGGVLRVLFYPIGGAVNDPVLSIRAGLDLEMPASYGASAAQIRADLATGRLTEAALNRAVRNVLGLIAKGSGQDAANCEYDCKEHHRIARKAAAQSAVLLKNENGILPLHKTKTLPFGGNLPITLGIRGGPVVLR